MRMRRRSCGSFWKLKTRTDGAKSGFYHQSASPTDVKLFMLDLCAAPADKESVTNEQGSRNRLAPQLLISQWSVDVSIAPRITGGINYG